MIQPHDIDPAVLEPEALAALLHFYAEAGVEWLVEDQPVDRFAAFELEKQARQQRGAAPSPAGQTGDPRGGAGQPQQRQPARANAPAPPRAPQQGPVALPDQEAVAEARRMAAAAMSHGELSEAILAFEHCNLKRGARQTVLASGDPASGILIVGSVPAADEDRDGTPFAGRDGELLDKMLTSIGLSRNRVMLVNALPWRPPGNRQPTPAEMDICRPFLERLLALAEPKAVLILGNFAARYLLQPSSSIHLMRGEWHPLQAGDKTLQALASLHPQDLLRAPQNKRLVWQDLLQFRQKLLEIGLI